MCVAEVVGTRDCPECGMLRTVVLHCFFGGGEEVAGKVGTGWGL